MSDVPRGLKHLTVWLLIGTALFLAVQAWQDRARRSAFSAEGGVIELRRAADGHFHWPGRVNGIEVEFLVDTGATRTALPQALAEQAQLQAEAPAQSSTAGGVASSDERSIRPRTSSNSCAISGTSPMTSWNQ